MRQSWDFRPGAPPALSEEERNYGLLTDYPQIRLNQQREREQQLGDNGYSPRYQCN